MLFTPRLARTYLTATVASVAIVAAGCASETATTTDANAAASGVKVVASTNVYAAIAQRIGGEHVQAQAILNDPSGDPHSFEATPKEQALIAGARLVIANGGGYDDFATSMAQAANPQPELIDAVAVSGLDQNSEHAEESHADESHAEESHADESHAEDHAGHDHGAFNEHVFYDLPSMKALGTAIAVHLGELDPGNAADYTANAAAFGADVDKLSARAAAIGADHPNLKAVVTEPVAGYLLEAAGIADVTPEGFSAAIEAETDPAVKDVAEVDQLLDGGTVRIVINNEQTSGPVTEQLTERAASQQIPVVGVTETLPEGTTDYVAWISGTLDKLEGAVASS